MYKKKYTQQNKLYITQLNKIAGFHLIKKGYYIQNTKHKSFNSKHLGIYDLNFVLTHTGYTNQSITIKLLKRNKIALNILYI